jgi:hypothetical protein
MIRAIPATSAPRNRRINRGKLVFSLPLVGYCFIAILVALHPPAPWVVAILGSPLVLVAFAVNRRALQRATGWGSCTTHGPPPRQLLAARMRRQTLPRNWPLARKRQRVNAKRNSSVCA